MQNKPQLISLSFIIILIFLISTMYGVTRLNERIYKLEVSIADAYSDASNANDELEELRAIIEELKSEVEDLQLEVEFLKYKR